MVICYVVGTKKQSVIPFVIARQMYGRTFLFNIRNRKVSIDKCFIVIGYQNISPISMHPYPDKNNVAHAHERIYQRVEKAGAGPM